MFQYDESFYKYIEQTKMDEQIIMPLILQWLSPHSIVDFGCAEGAWLEEALRYNSDINILGMDGDYVNRKRLKIPESNFMAVDLRKTIMLEQKFELAISTEVAEHIEEEFAEIFIDNIARVSDQVLFSAGIPGQGGEHHVNEQWQSYWIEKFERRGYYCDYSVRNYFWNESRISSWRRQNLLFFSRKRGSIAPERQLMNVIHPEEMLIKQKKFEKALEYYRFYMDAASILEQVIKKARIKNKKIVIYPYGNNGQLCEKVLRDRYEMEDYILADNIVTDSEKVIITAEQLKNMESGILVIDTCRNLSVHREVLDELRKYVDEENIYSIF